MHDAAPIRQVTREPLAMRFAQPFRISGYRFDAMPSVGVRIEQSGLIGRGEAAGVYYLGDDQPAMLAAIDSIVPQLCAGLDRQGLQNALPPCGARNAIDCALWELESCISGTPVWRLAGLDPPKPKITTFTLPADDPANLERKARDLVFAKAIKLKFDGDLTADSERLRVIRSVFPGTWIAIDANQGYNAASLDALEQLLVKNRVALLEQPLPRGSDRDLDGWRPPFLIAADESILSLGELEVLGALYDVINIKLDKCGGLTEALAMARRALAMGKEVMVGNMGGSGLAMAPAFLVAQLCSVVDLDGPWGLADQTDARLLFKGARVDIPEGYWGT